jgi:GH35 family endo-1,4-beta-xylanase
MEMREFLPMPRSLSFVRTELSDFLETYLVFISNYICMVCKKYKETKDTVDIINDITYLYLKRNAAAAHGDVWD